MKTWLMNMVHTMTKSDDASNVPLLIEFGWHCIQQGNRSMVQPTMHMFGKATPHMVLC